MEQARIFVSYSPHDKAFTEPIVEALRAIGVDVWYDEREVSAEPLLDEIQREIASRSRFIVILSRAALASPHLLAECAHAYALQRTERSRIMLPILVEHLEDRDLDGMPYLRKTCRVEANNLRPLPLDKIVSSTQWHLGLAMLESAPISDDVPPDVLTMNIIAQAGYFIGHRQYAQAIELLERATQLAPDNYDAWYHLAHAYIALQQWERCLDAASQASVCSVHGYARSQGHSRASALSLKAHALIMLERYEEALAAYDEVLTIDAIDPSEHPIFQTGLEILHTTAWSGKGVVLDKLGRYEEALAAHDRALAHYAQAWREKAATLRAAGRDDEADAAEQHLKELGG